VTRGVIAEIRDLVPIRPLVYGEALQLAEKQAAYLLASAGITGPSVPERIITDLPRVQVNRMSPFPVSGATEWSHGRWHVVLNGAEPSTRQRFSLAHELKHIIDHPFIDQIYANFPEHDRQNMTERICDSFAGCLLMPKPWVERAWNDGNQHLGDLAVTFGVSQSAMHVRLRQLGLVEMTPRCAVAGSTFSRHRYRRGEWSSRHHRSRASALH
jgi:Zn-dependent peptidase ImmA (M78 family)